MGKVTETFDLVCRNASQLKPGQFSEYFGMCAGEANQPDTSLALNSTINFGR